MSSQENIINIAYGLVRKVSERALFLDTYPQCEAGDEIQRTLDSEVDAATQKLRAATSERLEDYDDAELVVLSNLFVKIWGGKAEVPEINAHTIRDMLGANLGTSTRLLLALTTEDSPLVDVARLDWHEDGNFELLVSDPARLHKLFLEEVPSEKTQEHKDMSMKTAANVTSLIKELLLAIERRSDALGRCCPSFYSPDDAEKNLAAVAAAQEEINGIIAKIRVITGNRFKDYTDLEVSFAAHLWTRIWYGERQMRIDSGDLVRICGSNNIEMLEPFIRELLNGRSKVLGFTSAIWQSERGAGRYEFMIHSPDVLHTLFLGNLSTTEGEEDGEEA